MSLGFVLTLVIIIAIFGVVIWFVHTYVPMPAWAKGLITVVVIVAVLIWLLSWVGTLQLPVRHG